MDGRNAYEDLEERLPGISKLRNVLHMRCRRSTGFVMEDDQLQILMDNVSQTNQRSIDWLLQALPDEFLSNVLMWLPVRSLCEARIVCRRWNGCIKSPEFQKLWIENPGSRSCYFSDFER